MSADIRKIRYGMIGGGRGAFIGPVHRIAAAMDGHTELVCGAFSSDPEKSRASGGDLLLPADRCYGDFREMMEVEASLPESERMDFVSIVTTNRWHFPVAKLALESGFHVLSDKPATFNLAEAKELAALVKEKDLLYGITYNYSGYPMAIQMREMVRSGLLGNIRKVVIEYPQGWLATMLELTGQKQASWRVDPAISGAAGCVGDIGTHGLNLAEFVTGLKVYELLAQLTIFGGEERRLDDDGSMLLRFEGGAVGMLHCSQVCIGSENDLSIRVHGEKGSLEWHQVEPNTLGVSFLNQPKQIYRTAGGDYLCEAARAAARTPAGHPEGYLEGFANIYRNFTHAVHARLEGQPVDGTMEFPTIEAGVAGMAFIEAAVRSSEQNCAWVSLDR